MAKDSTIIAVLRQERKQLELKLAAISALLAQYEAKSTDSAAAHNRAEAAVGKVGGHAVAQAVGIAADTILDAAADVIRGRSAPMKTADIFNVLVKKGIPIKGKNPQNTLSARLSNSPRFKSHGRQGWTLVADSNSAPAGNTEGGRNG